MPGTPIVHISDDALVRAIVAAVGSQTFNARELMVHGRFAGRLRDIIGDMTPERIGKALQKIKGRDFDGYVLVHQGTDKDGSLWCVSLRR